MIQNPASVNWPAQPLDRTYRLLDRLGQGGMGTVFRAVHLLDGRSVAVKLVDLPDTTKNASVESSINPMFRLALAREFQTLASLHHPNVVRVFSYGFDQTLGPYVAMELLENSQHFLSAASRLDEKEKIYLLVQLLRALVYIHQRGVIHRDIKPGNVLVTASTEGPLVKLVDFGIATGDAQTVRLAGTVEYMAPELLLGNPPTAATDLWAVGILLYQLLMGRLPFADRTPTEVLGGILGEVREHTVSPTAAAFMRQYRSAQKSSPRPLEWTAATSELEVEAGSTGSASHRSAPAVPNFMLNYQGPLEGVLRKLLARKPEQRFQSAAEVLAELGRSMGMQLRVETTSTRESFLQATALTGRDAELDALKESLQSACSGHGSAWLIGGESGVGKSRLLFELRTLALVHGAWVAEGQAVAEGGEYFQGFLPLLRALCLRVELTDTEAAVLKDIAQEVPHLLGRPIPEAVKVKPEESLQRLADALLALFGRLSSPLLFLFEDLHWGRSESLELLSKLLPHLSQLPVLVVGSFRSDESPNLPERLPTAQYLPLIPLGRLDIERLSTSILGKGEIRTELIDYLERQTEGNVFFLVEILRSLAESAGELRRIGEGELPDQVLTSGIERVVDKRLERLQADYRPALEFSTVLGRQLDSALLLHAFPGLQLQDFLIQGANAAILELLGTEWRFAHDKLRERVLRRLSKAQRQNWHGRIAEAMEATYSEAQRQNQSAILATHFREAGLLERAVTYFLRAGTQAWRLYLLEDAQAQYSQAEALLALLPETVTTRGQRVDLLIQRIQVSNLLEYLNVQLDREKEARALLDLLRDSQGRLCQEDRKREARLNLYLGRAYYSAGQSAAAIQLFKEVVPVARELADQELILFPAYTIGMALIAQGNMECLSTGHPNSTVYKQTQQD